MAAELICRLNSMALLGDHDQELQPLNPVHPPANSAALAPHEVEEGARVPVRKHSLHEVCLSKMHERK